MRFCGKVGYSITVNKGYGVYEPEIVEKEYRGDVIRNSRKLESSDGVNDNININSNISIVADAFAYQNFLNIIYVEFMGVKWKVHNVEPQHPRLILHLGGLYNG